jgi:glycosyltransferase involved in cell wall biosynthesis
MHICLVLASWGEGGLERHVVELANGLSRYHQISVIVHPEMASRFNEDISVFTINFNRNRKNPFLLYELWSILKNNKFDIIHAQAGKAAIIVAPLLPYLKTKSVVTVHGIKNNIKHFLAFDQIIAVSGQVARKFDKNAPVNIIWNGLDISTHTVIEHQVCNRIKVQAIAVGRLDHVKGFDLLIEAWVGIDADLCIVGEGKEREALSKKIRDLNLEQRIRLLGHREDVEDLICQSDCLVISSRKEGGPYTLAEALLLETPVLATQVGMVEDFLPTEYICEINNIKSLNQLLAKYINNRLIFNQNFKTIYNKAKDNLSFQGMLANTLEVYHKLNKVIET